MSEGAAYFFTLHSAESALHGLKDPPRDLVSRRQQWWWPVTGQLASSEASTPRALGPSAQTYIFDLRCKDPVGFVFIVHVPYHISV